MPRTAHFLLEQASHLGVKLERGARIGLGLWIQRVFHLHGPQGILARSWQTGSTVFAVISVFVVVLVLSYF